MMLEAAGAAAADAGVALAEVDAILVPGLGYAGLHELARNAGLARPFFAAESLSGGSAVVSSLLVAALAIEAGLASVVLCGQAIDWGTSRREDVGRPHAEMRMKANLEMPFGWYPQVVHFAGMARRHMELHGTREEQLGAVAVAFRRHARLAGNAVLTRPLSLQSYLAAPYVAEPLRAADCCLVNDGAAAFIVTSAERARDLARPPVVVAGAGQGVSLDGEFSTLRRDYLSTPVAAAAPRAFAMAGIGPDDVDFVELYDNFTSMVLVQLEDLGFCGRGESGAFAEGGRLEIGGGLPANTAGGQLSQSFLFSANLVVEAARQLRGECGERQVAGAEVGVVTGYTGAQSAVAVLTRV